MFRFRETVFSGKNAIRKNVEEKTFYLPKAGYILIILIKRVGKSSTQETH